MPPLVPEHAFKYRKRHAEVAGEGEERAISFRTDREPAVARAQLHDVHEQIVHVVIIEIGLGEDDRVGAAASTVPAGEHERVSVAGVQQRQLRVPRVFETPYQVSPQRARSP